MTPRAKTITATSRMNSPRNTLAIGLLTLFTAIALSVFAFAAKAAPVDKPEKRIDAESVVSDSHTALKQLLAGSQHGETIKELVNKSRGVMIFPELLKGGFFFGGEGGTGVLLARAEDGSWSDPAFFSTGSLSFGLQAGVQKSRGIVILMNDRALVQALDTEFELGADTSVAIGSEGADREYSTTNYVKDAYYYAETDGGLYAGVSLEGGGFVVRDGLNHGYYSDDNASPKTIVLDRRYRNSHSQPLVSELRAIK
ncbi:MAG: lipid-binding SYLF domain-containing protein [Alphaproteobacteria bacterium]